MMPSRIDSKELAIQGMRDPGHGVPVCIGGSHRPCKSAPSQACPDMRVLNHVHAIVEIDKKETIGLRIQEKDYRCKERREDKPAFFWRSEQCRLFRTRNYRRVRGESWHTRHLITIKTWPIHAEAPK